MRYSEVTLDFENTSLRIEMASHVSLPLMKTHSLGILWHPCLQKHRCTQLSFSKQFCWTIPMNRIYFPYSMLLCVFRANISPKLKETAFVILELVQISLNILSKQISALRNDFSAENSTFMLLKFNVFKVIISFCLWKVLLLAQKTCTCFLAQFAEL